MQIYINIAKTEMNVVRKSATAREPAVFVGIFFFGIHLFHEGP